MTPEGEFTSVSAGDYTCWLRADGCVACWGFNSKDQASPPEGEFKSIDLGGNTPAG